MRKQIPFLVAIMPIVLLVSLILANVLSKNVDSLSGASQLALLISAMFTVALSSFYGVDWQCNMRAVSSSLISAFPAICILFMVGLISGSWMASGIIPSMIYYGLGIVNADFFLPVVVIITSIVSLITGTSWGTVATVGVAFVGIGKALGIDQGWVAGAIISGAYFGDKISPLSDTTNLASATAEVDIVDHIKSLLRTTVPSILITLLIFFCMSFFTKRNMEISDTLAYRQAISSIFVVSPWLLLVPLLVIVLIVKKIAAVPVLFISSLIAIILSFLVQRDYISSFGDTTSVHSVYILLSSILYGPISPSTGNDLLDSLFATGGMAGMLNTIWLIISAMFFAGTMQAGGFLDKITSALMLFIRGRFSLVFSTSLTCMIFNVITGDQYISIMIPGKMFANSYKERNIKPTILSRTLEDSATVTSPLVPWNTCGATQATILHVSTLTYAPYAFFCWISPLMTLLFALIVSLKESSAQSR